MKMGWSGDVPQTENPEVLRGLPEHPPTLTGGWNIQGGNFMSKNVSPENCVLFDWLTFSSKCDSIQTLISLLGLESVPFEERPHGRNGYRSMMSYENINILYDGRENMGICLDMTGTGCRAFETYSTTGWKPLLETICGNEDYHISRLDVAGDDHTGLLDIDVLRDDTDDHSYVSKSRSWEVDYGSEGTSIYHGSRKSDMLIRIYDKAAEQGLEDEHWVRVELQMRNENASGFLREVLEKPIGEVFAGVLFNYLRYVEPTKDVNMSRWPLKDYWQRFLGEVKRIRVWSAPGVDYDIWRLSNYIINQTGNALDCYLRIFGMEDLVRELGKRAIRRSPKYDRLLEEHMAWEEAFINGPNCGNRSNGGNNSGEPGNDR